MSTGPIVLIVDDDVMNRDMLQTVFRRSGFQVLTAASGPQALALVQETVPSVIVCDVRLGSMSGYELCAAFKADPQTAATPVIILTAYDSEAERTRALEAGAADFLPKMRGWQPLLERVKALTA